MSTKVNISCHRCGFSLLEMITVIGILGVVAVVIIARTSDSNDSAKTAACHVYKGDIEVQSELWHHNNGTWPLANLSDVGADVSYFPEGLPVCPVDGSVYTIDTSTGLVIGHTH